MFKMKKVLSLVLIVMVLMSSSIVFASKENIEKTRQRAKEDIDSAQWVTYQEVIDNPSAYEGSIISFRGKMVFFNYENMTGMFIEDGDETKPFFVGIIPYRFKLDTYYTIAGTMKGTLTPKGNNRPPWVLVTEINHLPMLSEYGL